MKIAVLQRLTFARGFSLVELAVVLVIVALLIASLVFPLSAQQDIRARQETEKTLADIREALLGFSMAKGRLPCPADPTIASGSANAGTEDCARTEGVLPWAELGVPQLDAWGRRFTYRVTDSFKDAIAAGTVTPPGSCVTIPTQSSFAICSEGDITVTDGSTMIANKVPAVVVSHGANGAGAYNTSGGTNPAPTDASELENTNTNTTFVSRTTDAGFDDLVMWVPSSVLMNRMITTGKLP